LSHTHMDGLQWRVGEGIGREASMDGPWFSIGPEALRGMGRARRMEPSVHKHSPLERGVV